MANGAAKGADKGADKGAMNRGTAGATGPVRVTPLNGAAAAAVAWRSRGELHITVIVKATFAFAADAEMPRVEPQQVVHGEVHHGNNPGRSVRLTSDLAPHLERADVLFTGHAHAPPPGAPVHALPVRLAISDEDGPLLDKELLVKDRAGFQRMPLVYERALRGENDQENFLGVQGTGDASEPEATIVDPLQPARAAGFGPIARAWPARRRLLGATPRKALDAAIAEIPDPFEWAYYQAAPPDQRTRYLRGGEWIELHGLHPTLPRFRTRLPGARGRARVHGLSAFGVGEGHPLELNADILRIDGDEQRCTLVFRGSLVVPGEAALAAATLVAGVELPGEPLEWPDRPAEQGAAAQDPAKAADAAGRARGVGGDGDGGDPLGATQAAPAAGARTVSLSDAGAVAAALASAAATPFRPGSAPGDIAGPAEGAHGPRVDTGTLSISSVEEGPKGSPAATLALLPEEDAGATDQPALPFQPAPPGGALPPSMISREPVTAEERAGSGTLALAMEDDWEPVAGAPGPSGAGALAAPPALVPAAVEAPETAAAPLPAPEPAAPPPEPLLPEPPPPPRPTLSASPARSPEADEPPPAPPPRRPPPPPPERPALPTPSPALRRSLYERFDRKR
ncbi:DUF2169 family type VI secretion system accessory protein [Sorangium sp. So ce426]|uniref:DUF2169 family type VI secretion system accessory protein n=1 Tax=Sorangium sp. So ce426 TaxID=3133312 RepID=UPI003F5B69F2